MGAYVRLVVLWLLSRCCRKVVEDIYNEGLRDGRNEVTTAMRADLLTLQAASKVQRARDFEMGFRCGLKAMEGLSTVQS